MRPATTDTMRLAILCNCLEPECDGVGDNVTRLAYECSRLGASILLVAINDHLLDAPGSSHGQVVRMSAAMPWQDRAALLKQTLDTFKPDWVRIDLVPFAMDARGLFYPFINMLKSCSGTWAWAIMFHEIWLGVKPQLPLKLKLLGYLQKRAVCSLVRTLRPRLCWTSNAIYQDALRQAGINAEIQPLVSNIPIHSNPLKLSSILNHKEATVDSYPEANTDINPDANTDINPERYADSHLGDNADSYPDASAGTQTEAAGLVMLVPYSVPANWKPEPLLALLAALKGKQNGPLPRIISVGNQGPGRAIWQKLVQQHRALAEWIELGKQPAPVISSLMQQADFGLALSPYSLLGKSSSLATMLEHGLRVIATFHQPEYHKAVAVDSHVHNAQVRLIDRDTPAGVEQVLSDWPRPQKMSEMSARISAQVIKRLEEFH